MCDRKVSAATCHLILQKLREHDCRIQEKKVYRRSGARLRDRLPGIERHRADLCDGFANAEVIVREGIPYVEILKVARENEADLIVMAHHSSDLSDDDADIGSTVEQVVLRSACPVASVTRPEAR